MTLCPLLSEGAAHCVGGISANADTLLPPPPIEAFPTPEVPQRCRLSRGRDQEGPLAGAHDSRWRSPQASVAVCQGTRRRGLAWLMGGANEAAQAGFLPGRWSWQRGRWGRRTATGRPFSRAGDERGPLLGGYPGKGRRGGARERLVGAGDEWREETKSYPHPRCEISLLIPGPPGVRGVVASWLPF